MQRDALIRLLRKLQRSSVLGHLTRFIFCDKYTLDVYNNIYLYKRSKKSNSMVFYYFFWLLKTIKPRLLHILLVYLVFKKIVFHTIFFLPAILPYRWKMRSTSVLLHWKVFKLPTNTRELTAWGSWELVWFPTLQLILESGNSKKKTAFLAPTTKGKQRFADYSFFQNTLLFLSSAS